MGKPKAKSDIEPTKTRRGPRRAVRRRRKVTPREELLALHRRIFRENKRRIDRGAHDETGELPRYRAAYTRASSTYVSVSDIETLTAAACDADVIYVGDFHTCKQAQRTYLELLKRISEKRPVVAAMEIIPSRHQLVLDAWLRGALDEDELLDGVRFHQHWPFDNFPNFRPIFEHCRDHQIPMMGIDVRLSGPRSLRERDRHAANIIADVRARHPDAVVLVLIGDLHISPSHLPRSVNEALNERGQSARRLIVYQNSEQIYWKLALDELEQRVDVVRVDDDAFCVMNTPPIILQQTYLNWLEREEDTIDFHDAQSEFITLLHRIAEFLEIALPPHAEDVEVFTCGELSFLERLREDRLFSEEELGEIKRQVRSCESYFIPRVPLVYLANLSTNHAAEEAAHYVKHLCAAARLPDDTAGAFYANALHEAMGFFGSKIINHRRGAPLEEDFRRLLLMGDEFGPLERRIAMLVLLHKDMERGDRPPDFDKIYSLSGEAWIGVTHALGYMLGEQLYYGMISDLVPKELIRDLFYDPFTATDRARSKYFELIRLLAPVRVPELS